MLLPLDLETTGLDPRENHILEVAWTIVHDDLRPHLLDLNSIVATPSLAARQQIEEDQFIQNMHGATGLLDDLDSDGTLMLSDIEDRILQDIKAGVPDDEPLYLFGASVHFDLAFIRNWMPRLAKRLSHRVYDTSTLKAFFGSLGVDHGVVNANQHRAKDDVTEVLTVARSYREAVEYYQMKLSG